MTPVATTLGMLIATLLMLLAGISKKHIEWKFGDDSRRPRRKPPRPRA